MMCRAGADPRCGDSDATAATALAQPNTRTDRMPTIDKHAANTPIERTVSDQIKRDTDTGN